MIDWLSDPASAIGAPSHLDGAALGAVWSIPFAGLLLSIALLPLAAPHFWEHHFGKVAAFWVLALLLPCVVFFGAVRAAAEVLHTLLLDYVPFILLLFTLFVVPSLYVLIAKDRFHRLVRAIGRKTRDGIAVPLHNVGVHVRTPRANERPATRPVLARDRLSLDRLSVNRRGELVIS